MLGIITLIVGIVLLSAALALIFLNKKSKSEDEYEYEDASRDEKSITSNMESTSAKSQDDDRTYVFSEWSIEQLDKDGKVIAKEEIDTRRCCTEEGFSIGRSSDCDFKIQGDSKYVGKVHARIGYDNDEKVYFLMDNDSTNGTFYKGQKIDCFDITPLTENEVVYLADIPICFHHNMQEFSVTAPLAEEKTETVVEQTTEDDDEVELLSLESISELEEKTETVEEEKSKIKPLKRS